MIQLKNNTQNQDNWNLLNIYTINKLLKYNNLKLKDIYIDKSIYQEQKVNIKKEYKNIFQELDIYYF